jgi:two-component system chemotaxis sensor kinase CheA
MSGTSTSKGLDEIRQIFVAECADGLDEIESGLLDLEKGTDTQETINDIFRGAHSIKGGAATFGYKHIADFTHVMETLLDKVRGKELPVTPTLTKVFLEAVDCLRAMVETMDEEDSHDEERAEELKEQMSVFLSGGSLDHEDSEPEQSVAEEPAALAMLAAARPDRTPGSALWGISFRPKPEFLKRGNQPQHIFRALAELGRVLLKVDTSGLPAFDTFTPSDLYLAWEIELDTTADEARIREVFDWVELDAEIVITRREKPASVADILRAAGLVQPEVEPVAEVAVVEEPAAAEKQGGNDRKAQRKESSSIRVDIEKIDVLLNLVGEMVINQAMLNQLARNKQAKNNSVEIEQALVLLERTTRELQEAVMEIRMLPVSVTFSRFPRLVYDLGAKLKKQVELKITGEHTELDKTVLEKISDPLLHLVRNSLDHGIESPEERIFKGKPQAGQIHLSASHEGGSVVIRVTDDGAGLNADKILKKAIEKGLVPAGAKLNQQQINDLIFAPGFSTADTVTDVSGRGVGMDVVRSNIEEIGGRVEVYTERDKGSTFQITLPLTLAILDGQLIRVGQQVYVLPLLSIVETVQVKLDRLNILSGKEVVYRLRGEAIPVVDMRRLYKIAGNEPLTSFADKQLIIVESERKQIGLVVDEMLDQHQVVIKSLENNFVKVPGMLGATILGDGTVSLILDVTTLAGNVSKESLNSIKH